MTIAKVVTGDWVQALEEIAEVTPDGRTLVHAVAGGIGHVMDVDGDWATVTWERTGTTTDCLRVEFKRLGNGDVGRSPEKTANRRT